MEVDWVSKKVSGHENVMATRLFINSIRVQTIPSRLQQNKHLFRWFPSKNLEHTLTLLPKVNVQSLQ